MSRNPKRLLREISLIIHCPRGPEASANIKTDFPYDAIMSIYDLLLTLDRVHELWWCAVVPFSRSGAHSHFQVAVLFKHKSTIWEESWEAPQKSACSKQLEWENWENTTQFCLFVCFHDSSCLSHPHPSCEDFQGRASKISDVSFHLANLCLAHDHSDMLCLWCWATLFPEDNVGFSFPLWWFNDEFSLSQLSSKKSLTKEPTQASLFQGIV